MFWIDFWVKIKNDMLYKQKKQEEMEKQGELVQEQILSTAPLQVSWLMTIVINFTSRAILARLNQLYRRE